MKPNNNNNNERASHKHDATQFGVLHKLNSNSESESLSCHKHVHRAKLPSQCPSTITHPEFQHKFTMSTQHEAACRMKPIGSTSMTRGLQAYIIGIYDRLFACQRRSS